MANDSVGRPTLGQRVDDIKASIPGTREYEARHGYDRMHTNVQHLKAYLPGTQAHHNKYASSSKANNSSKSSDAAPPLHIDDLRSTGVMSDAGTAMPVAGMSSDAAGPPGTSHGDPYVAALPDIAEHGRLQRDEFAAHSVYDTAGTNTGITGASNDRQQASMPRHTSPISSTAGSYAGAEHVQAGTKHGSQGAAASPGTGHHHRRHNAGLDGSQCTGSGMNGIGTAGAMRDTVDRKEQHHGLHYNGIGYTSLSPDRRHSITSSGTAASSDTAGTYYTGMGTPTPSASGSNGGASGERVVAAAPGSAEFKQGKHSMHGTASAVHDSWHYDTTPSHQRDQGNAMPTGTRGTGAARAVLHSDQKGHITAGPTAANSDSAARALQGGDQQSYITADEAYGHGRGSKGFGSKLKQLFHT